MSYLVRGLQDLRISRALLEYAGYLCHTSQLFQQEQSRYSPQDVTIVVPTIDHAADVLDAIRSWQACKPNKIIIVTPTEMTASLEMVLSQLKATNIVLLAVPTYGKRSSMVAGLRQVTTELFVFADDDVQWKPKTLQGLLAGFDDPLVGGVQVRQRVRPSGKDFTLWESFGASRLTHRNIFCASSSYLNDGDVLSLAGRTMAYKTECLQTPELYQAFIQDFWRGKYRLKSGDDCFLTSWIYHRGWKTAFQNDKEYEIATTVKHDRNFLKQTVRWSRNTARFFCRDFAFAIHQSDPRHRRRVLLNWTTSYFIDVCNLVDMAYVCYTVINSFMSGGTAVVNDAHPFNPANLGSVLTWYLFIVAIENGQHLWTSPRPWLLLPMLALYGYVRTAVKVYAMFTLHKTGWGTRQSADKEDKVLKDGGSAEPLAVPVGSS